MTKTIQDSDIQRLRDVAVRSRVMSEALEVLLPNWKPLVDQTFVSVQFRWLRRPDSGEGVVDDLARRLRTMLNRYVTSVVRKILNGNLPLVVGIEKMASTIIEARTRLKARDWTGCYDYDHVDGITFGGFGVDGCVGFANEHEPFPEGTVSPLGVIEGLEILLGLLQRHEAQETSK